MTTKTKKKPTKKTTRARARVKRFVRKANATDQAAHVPVDLGVLLETQKPDDPKERVMLTLVEWRDSYIVKQLAELRVERARASVAADMDTLGTRVLEQTPVGDVAKQFRDVVVTTDWEAYAKSDLVDWKACAMHVFTTFADGQSLDAFDEIAKQHARTIADVEKAARVHAKVTGSAGWILSAKSEWTAIAKQKDAELRELAKQRASAQ